MYQVWTKEDYQELYTMEEYETLDNAKAAILTATKLGHVPILTQEVPFTVSVEIGDSPMFRKQRDQEPGLVTTDKKKKEAKVEAKESGPETDQGAGYQGNESV